MIDRLSGALATLALLAVAAGGASPFVSSDSPIGPIARILDSLSPWLLAMGFLFAFLAALLGMRFLGAVLCLVAAACALQLLAEHHRLSLPLAQELQPDVRIVFMNVLHTNAAQSHAILDAVLERDPDILVFAEAEGMYPAMNRLRQRFDFVSPCSFNVCELLVATKRMPRRHWQLQLNPAWPKRYAVTEFEAEDGDRYFIAASHLAKPWFSGLSRGEYARLASQYDWLDGPIVAVGDFNAAPWSMPMRGLLRHSGMRTLRWPLATWPADAGRFGIPIDHILVHEGARVVRIEPFGSGLNSNHRGFVADIALP